MASAGNHKNDRELSDALSKLFDAVGPATRAEAEEELRATGIDPDDVGLRIRQLADEMLVNGGRSKGAATTSARILTPTRVAWSLAAALILCLVGWALTREARQPDGLLQQYRERLQRERPQDDQRMAARLPRAENAPSTEGESEVQEPAPTAAPPSPPVVGAGADDVALPPGVAVDRIDVPLPRGGIIVLAGEIPSGETVTARNLEAYNTSLTPGLQWAVRNGLQLRMIERHTVYLPAEYRAATERYAGHARIGPDGLSLKNYSAGLPFPAIDPNDGQAAIKIMWNYEYRPFATDDLEARDFELESGALGENGARMTIDRRMVFDTFRRLYYNGRLFADPKPRLRNPDGIRFRESWHAAREPIDLRGDGLVSTRYVDPQKLDDTFQFFARERRVRRTLRSRPIADHLVDPDSFFGFSGSLASMKWRLVGAGEGPGCVHAENRPVKWGDRSADFVFDDVWEMRPVYIVEGLPTRDDDPYGRRVLYIDQEAWVVLFADAYDRKGELKHVWLNMFSAEGSDDGGGMLDNPAAVMIDVQTRHATRIAVPSPRNPNAGGWTFNQGEAGGITEEWFRLQNLIDGAR